MALLAFVVSLKFEMEEGYKKHDVLLYQAHVALIRKGSNKEYAESDSEIA